MATVIIITLFVIGSISAAVLWFSAFKAADDNAFVLGASVLVLFAIAVCVATRQDCSIVSAGVRGMGVGLCCLGIGWLVLALTYTLPVWPASPDLAFDIGVAITRAVPMFLLGVVLFAGSLFIK